MDEREEGGVIAEMTAWIWSGSEVAEYNIMSFSWNPVDQTIYTFNIISASL